MTQLFIAGTETILPQDFQATVKRENPVFTKSGEYTYDVTLQLGNPVNQRLYDFLHRLNRTAQIPTGRRAMLMADGHVVTRGQEIITRWTHDTVTLQIVSGESELNFVIGQDKTIEELDMGQVGTLATMFIDGQPVVYSTADYCLPPIRLADGSYLNSLTHYYDQEEWQQQPTTHPYDPDQDEPGSGNYHDVYELLSPMPQPFLIPYLERLLLALGYHVEENQLRGTQFERLFLLQTASRTRWAAMLPGWTVKDFLCEVERLCNVLLLTDNSQPDAPSVRVVQKGSFYLTAQQYTLRNVTDEYEAELTTDDDQADEEFTASSVAYDMPSHRWARLMQLPEGISERADVREFADFDALRTAALATGSDALPTTATTLLRDVQTGRTYIKMARRETWATGTREYLMLYEADQFRALKRDGAKSTIELKITPAPMAPDFLTHSGREIVNMAENDTATPTAQSGTQQQEEKDFEEVIRSYSEEKTEQADVYCAFFGTRNAYTDGYHAAMQHQLYGDAYGATPVTDADAACSLRLHDLDESFAQGAYTIDTTHSVTFETCDRRHIDTRSVYVIRGRRYVVRSVEETFGIEGRQTFWKLTCHPISISDATLEERWVLSESVWDDGGRWLDDGLWLDGPGN